MAGEAGDRTTAGPKSGRRRKHPKNTEWRGDTLWGRKRIKGTLRRWSLRTGDVDTCSATGRGRHQADDVGGVLRRQPVRYEDIAASWAERHIIHEVGANAAKRYAVSLRQLEPFLLPLFLDEIDKAKIDEIVTARRAQGVSTSTIRNDLTALSSVLKFADVDSNPALARLQRLKAGAIRSCCPTPPTSSG
jgi:integrase/recombinase XerD